MRTSRGFRMALMASRACRHHMYYTTHFKYVTSQQCGNSSKHTLVTLSLQACEETFPDTSLERHIPGLQMGWQSHSPRTLWSHMPHSFLLQRA